MALSVAQLVACSHTQPVIGWHNLSLPLIGWHSCLLSVSIPALPPAQASTLHMLSSILLVGLTGTNLPSHFVQKIKSVRADTETCPLPHLWFSGSWHQTMDWTAADKTLLSVSSRQIMIIYPLPSICGCWTGPTVNKKYSAHSIKIALPDLCPALKGSWWTPAH